MFTTSFKSLRRLSGHVLTLLLSSACLCADAAAQMPQVVSSTAVAVPHNEKYGAPWQNAPSNRGDFVLFDFKSGGFYQYPGNGGPEVEVGPPNKFIGGFTDSGIAIDPRNNNMILNNNYSGGLMLFPYDAATGTWDIKPKVLAQGLQGNLNGACGNYFQSAGMTMNRKGILAVGTENGCGVEIFTVPVDLNGNFGTVTPIVSNMKNRAKTIAMDDLGNIYWNEDGGLAGALFLPAGTTGLTSEKTVQRVDPSLGMVQGVAVDNAGNLYIADAAAGEYLVPLVGGVPATAQAVFLTPAAAAGNAGIDQIHSTLFFPTSGYGGITDVVKILLNRADLGSTAVGATGATGSTITYAFSGAVTLGSFVIQEAGGTADFAVGTAGSCAVGTTYAANGTCTVSVSFKPHTVGDISASLAMLDGSGNVLNTTLLHGVGQGSSVAIAPATESVIGAGFTKPSQLATDAAGNVYIADSGSGKVLVFAAGSGAAATPTSIGTGLSAPTGVAVDGTGNVYIADSGSVYKVPFIAGALNAASQVTLKTGLGANASLAVDGIGNLFIADPANKQVVSLTPLALGYSETDYAGFAQLSAIAADKGGNLYIADGANLIEISSYGVQSTLLTSLAKTTGLAVDASGAVYVSSTAGTTRIPNVGGTLSVGSASAIAAAVTSPASVAVDSLGNAYVLDSTALNVDFVNSNGSLNLGTLTSTTGTQTAGATVVDNGNLPLNVTGFSSSADYSVTANTCVGTPIAVGANCSATVTFNPGPGDQGTLTALLLAQSDASNSPIGINVTGVGAALAASTTALTVTAPTVTTAPVVVTVASKSGQGATPTGTVTLTVTGNGLVKPVVATGTLAAGTFTFNATDLQTGTYTFTVAYTGDRVYGTSMASTSAKVGTGAVVLAQPSAASLPKYVLSQGQGSEAIYNAQTISTYLYQYPLVVKAADGSPLIGVPVYSGKVQTGVDYGTVTYEIAGGTPVCNGTAAMIKVGADGTAPFPTACLSINTSNNQIPNLLTSYTITPVYSGNSASDYAPVTGAPFTVTAVAHPMVLLTTNPTSLSVTAGTAATANITVTSLLGYGVADAQANLNNYSLPVELECDSLPAHASCTFTYPNPDPSDANSTPVTTTTPGAAVLSLNTNVAVGTVTNASIGRTGAVFAGLFSLSLFGLAYGRKRTMQAGLLRVLCLLTLTGSVVAGLTSCSSANISSKPILTTPAGTYTITVTAKQVGSKVVPGSQNGTTVTVAGSGNQESVPFTMQVTVH